jgi:hypothetical protein
MKIFPVVYDGIVNKYKTCKPDLATGFVIEQASDYSAKVGHRFHFDVGNGQTYWCGDQIAFLEKKYCNPDHEVSEEWLIGKLKEMPVWEVHIKALDIPISPRWNVKVEFPKPAAHEGLI